MKGKNVFILLLVLIAIAALAAVALLGVGNVTSTDSESSDDVAELEILTDENGEYVTDENGNWQAVLASTTEAETTDEDETSDSESATETTTEERVGYGGYKNIKLGLDLKGGVYIVYGPEDGVTPSDDEMEAAISMLQERVEYKGYYDAEVSKEGTSRIRVEIPGVEDAAAAVEEIGEAAHLTFRAMNDDGTPGEILVDGTNVADADKAYQNNEIVVTITFDEVGKQAFAEATANNIGNQIGIYMDDILISAPTVNQAITDGNAVITGNFDAESAEELAAKIRSGSLPFSLIALEYNAVGARLGADSLSTSVKAGSIGVILVLLFMLIVYRVPGLIADIALVGYTAINIIVLSLSGISLTLPGVAGIILGIGMAVDANVIVFERIKEEIRAGKSIKTAIHNGFDRALSAILDGNITTLIACAVLLWLGTGTIKGFAQTLILSIVVSMFSALVVTRILLNLCVNIGIKSPKLYGGK